MENICCQSKITQLGVVVPSTNRSSTSGKAAGSHKHLEGEHNKRLSDRLPVKTTSKNKASYSTVLCRAEPIISGGDQRTSRQRSHVEVQNHQTGFYSNLFLVPKKDGGQSPVINLKALNRNPYIEGPNQSQGLVSKGGPERCILRNPDPQIPPPISQVHISREMLSVPVLPIWAVISPMGLYQDPKTSISSPSRDRGMTDSIHRRYSSLGGVQRTSQGSCGGSSIPPTMPRFQSKPEKIGNDTSPGNGIPGINSGHSPDGAETPSGKDKKDLCGIMNNDEKRAHLGQSSSSFSGEDECNFPGDTSSPIIFSPSTDGIVRHIEQKFPVLQGTSISHTGMQRGINVVGHPHDKVEWEIPSQEGSGLSDRFRCIPDRVGCNLSKPEDRRSMVSDRGQYAYKLPGTTSCNASSKDIPEEQIQDVSASQIGQYHSSGIHKQSGRNSLQAIGRLSKKSMDVVLGKEYPHHSPAPARCSEYNSRCGVTDDGGSVRLATEPSPVQQDCLVIRSHRDGHVCHSTDHSVPSLFQLAARSLCISNRCFSAGLVTDKGLCQPTMEYDRSCPIPSTDAADTNCLSGTSLEDTTVVPPAVTDVGCNTTSLSSQSDNIALRSTGSHPPASCVVYLGKDTETRSFQRKLPHSCLSHGELRPTDLTTHSLASGIAGVVQGVQIPFQVLSGK